MISSVHKEKVEIISGNTRIKHKKYKVIDGCKLELKKANKGRGNVGVYAKFDNTCFYYYRSFFGGLKRKLFLVEGSSECVSFGEGMELKLPTREDIKRMFESEVVQKAGRVNNKVEVPIILYLLIGAVFVLQLFMFLSSNGMLRPPT